MIELEDRPPAGGRRTSMGCEKNGRVMWTQPFFYFVMKEGDCNRCGCSPAAESWLRLM